MYVHLMANEILTHAQKRLANLQALRILGELLPQRCKQLLAPKNQRLCNK